VGSSSGLVSLAAWIVQSGRTAKLAKLLNSPVSMFRASGRTVGRGQGGGEGTGTGTRRVPCWWSNVQLAKHVLCQNQFHFVKNRCTQWPFVQFSQPPNFISSIAAFGKINVWSNFYNSKHLSTVQKLRKSELLEIYYDIHEMVLQFWNIHILLVQKKSYQIKNQNQTFVMGINGGMIRCYCWYFIYIYIYIYIYIIYIKNDL
jgi:hypothetical protein